MLGRTRRGRPERQEGRKGGSGGRKEIREGTLQVAHLWTGLRAQVALLPHHLPPAHPNSRDRAQHKHRPALGADTQSAAAGRCAPPEVASSPSGTAAAAALAGPGARPAAASPASSPRPQNASPTLPSPSVVSHTWLCGRLGTERHLCKNWRGGPRRFQHPRQSIKVNVTTRARPSCCGRASQLVKGFPTYCTARVGESTCCGQKGLWRQTGFLTASPKVLPLAQGSSEGPRTVSINILGDLSSRDSPRHTLGGSGTLGEQPRTQTFHKVFGGRLLCLSGLERHLCIPGS